MADEHMIRMVQFNPDGSIALEYMSASDQRDNGMMMGRSLLVPVPDGPGVSPSELRLVDLLEDLSRAAERVLTQSLDLHENARVAQLDDDDEDRPYDNPLPDR